MKLFEKIPASFFSVLASPNRELYWTALVTLHHLLEYDLNIPVEDYCIALGDTLSDMELTAEDALDEEEQRLIRQPNGKVRWIIHRLKRAGWLDTEYRDGTFEEVIAPRDYADQVIRLLLELEQSETKEYNSLVFSTYSGLKQAYEEKTDRMYEALLTARRNTTELLQDLKSLYHNIRYYHQIIGQAVDVNQLLHDYYDEYKGMLDRIYHPIKTMDSLPHYRQPILDILNALLVDDEIMERAVGRMVQLHPDEDPAQARRYAGLLHTGTAEQLFQCGRYFAADRPQTSGLYTGIGGQHQVPYVGRPQHCGQTDRTAADLVRNARRRTAGSDAGLDAKGNPV